MSCAAVGSLGGCFQADATKGLPCTNDDACGALSCEYGVCGGPTRCAAGAGVGDYCYVLTDEAFPVGSAPAALAIADVNSDFVRDIVTADGGSRGVSVLLGDGTGAFTHHDLGLPQLSAAPTALGIGHLDGTGWGDIAVVTDDGHVHAVLVGEEGVLGSVASVATPVARAARPTIADFVQDGAGVSDIAVLGEEGVFVARNIDLASFEPTWRATAVDNPRDMLTIPDAAGDPAFAYVARVADDDISSLDRKGDGTFSSVQSIPVGRGPVSFAISDLNSDDYTDVLVVSSTGGLWLTKGKSANRDEWSPPEQVYDLGWVPSTLDVLDLDDDGDPDVVVSGATPDGHSDVFLLENDGEGRIIYGGSLGLRDASAAALADLDRDGVPEVVITAADDDAVRLARRAKAPPMPGDDDGSSEASTAASVGSASATDSGEATGTSLEEGPFETGVDPTEGDQCMYVGSVGLVDLVRCTPLSAYGMHDHLGFALVDQDYYDDIVTVVRDESETSRIVAFCSQLSYGYGYGESMPVQCLDIPLPAAATGIAGGTFLDGRPAVAVTHEDTVTIALRELDATGWDLETTAPGGTALADPRFYDLVFDGQQELLFTAAEGLFVASAETDPVHTLVYSHAGLHEPRGVIPARQTDGPKFLAADLMFAVDDLDGTGTTGAIMLMDYDPSGATLPVPQSILEEPMLVGLREFDFVVDTGEGLFIVGVVGAARNLAIAFAPADDSAPSVYIDESFSEITTFVVTNLDGEPIPDDMVFIGSKDGAPSAVHVVVNDLDSQQQHLELEGSAGATDVAQWTVSCGSPGFTTTEILVTTPFGVERVRAQNGCL